MYNNRGAVNCTVPERKACLQRDGNRQAGNSGTGIRNAVCTASRFLKESGHSNIIIEIANEQDISPFRVHPCIQEEEGMAGHAHPEKCTLASTHCQVQPVPGLIVYLSGKWSWYAPEVILNLLRLRQG